MSIEDSDAVQIECIGYYKLKNFANALGTLTQVGINYDRVDFTEVLGRYYLDKELRLALLHAIEKIEVALKTRVTCILGEKYVAFGYLNFSDWAPRNKEKILSSESDFKERLRKALKYARKNNNLSLDYKNVRNFNEDDFPTVWLAFELLTLDEMSNLLSLMNVKNLKKISASFKCQSDEIVAWFRVITLVRNICAHNSNLLDHKFISRPKINRQKKWHTYLFKIRIANGETIFTDRIAIALLIIAFLVNNINADYVWDKLIEILEKLGKTDRQAQIIGFKNRTALLNFIDDLLRNKKVP